MLRRHPSSAANRSSSLPLIRGRGPNLQGFASVTDASTRRKLGRLWIWKLRAQVFAPKSRPLIPTLNFRCNITLCWNLLVACRNFILGSNPAGTANRISSCDRHCDTKEEASAAAAALNPLIEILERHLILCSDSATIYESHSTPIRAGPSSGRFGGRSAAFGFWRGRFARGLKKREPSLCQAG